MQSIKAKAYSLLAKRAYFSKQLEKKLLEKGYFSEEITAVIKECKSQGWLNDKELALRFIEKERKKGYGAKIIKQKLREKAGRMDIEVSESEKEIRAFVIKRYRRDLPEKKQKVMMALFRRGISYDLINKVLDSITEE